MIDAKKKIIIIKGNISHQIFSNGPGKGVGQGMRKGNGLL